MTKAIFVICCLLGWGTTIFAQQGTVTAGGEASGSGGSISYTIGETNNSSATGIDGNINQGMQQPYEIFTISISAKFNANVSLFPNPTSDYVVISVEGTNADNLRYELFDMNGKLLQSAKMSSNETSILMREYASASYFVKIYNNENESKNFKINKN